MSTIAAFLILSAGCAAVDPPPYTSRGSSGLSISSASTSSISFGGVGCDVHGFASRQSALNYLQQHDGSGNVLLEVKEVADVVQTKRPVYDVQVKPRIADPADRPKD